VGPIRKPDLDIANVKSIKGLGLSPERLEQILLAVKEALQADSAGI
jgi:hypothetical protein